MNTMNAVLIRAPMNFGVVQIPVPEIPIGGMLLKVNACGLCGSDTRTLRSGHHRITLPWVIGHEISGVVIGKGPNSKAAWEIGTPLAIAPIVYCGTCDFCQKGLLELCENYREIGQAWPGGMAEYIAIPEEAIQLGVIQPIPAGLDLAQAAISEPISACLHAIELSAIQKGQTVVIFGAGMVGCTLLQLAHLNKAGKTIIIDVHNVRLGVAKTFDPDYSLNPISCDVVKEIMQITSGKGADLVFTATAAPIVQVQAVEIARRGGRVLIFAGLPVEQAKQNIDMNKVHYKGLHIIGTTIYAPRHQKIALELIASGKLNVEKMITRFPLKEFERGASLAMHGKIIKAVFIP